MSFYDKSEKKKGAWSNLKGKAGDTVHAAGSALFSGVKKTILASGFVLGSAAMGKSVYRTFIEGGLESYDDAVGLLGRTAATVGLAVSAKNAWFHGLGSGLKSAFKMAAVTGLGYMGAQGAEGLYDSWKNGDDREVVENVETLEQRRDDGLDLTFSEQEQTGNDTEFDGL